MPGGAARGGHCHLLDNWSPAQLGAQRPITSPERGGRRWDKGWEGALPPRAGRPFLCFFPHLWVGSREGGLRPVAWRQDCSGLTSGPPSMDAHGHSPCRPFSSHLPVQPALERASCALLQTPSPRHFL